MTINNVCRDLLITIDGYQQDSAKIAELIATGKYVVHHSRRYNDHYKPHYRIVHHTLIP